MTPARQYAPGIGQAVADRTINRIKTVKFDGPVDMPFRIRRDDGIALDEAVLNWASANGYEICGYHVDHGDDQWVGGTLKVTQLVRRENWGEVADRVSAGNISIHPYDWDKSHEFDKMQRHMRQASLLMSGRHLQHGDEDQARRPGEVFTNCSTSPLSSLLYRMLLNGSGVGRAYDDDLMITDWCQSPHIVPVIEGSHADVLTGEVKAMSPNDAAHMYAGTTQKYLLVPDSREGWAQCVEMAENCAYEKAHRDSVLLLDFSKIRKRGSPIAGMQGRPASGPGLVMAALDKVNLIRNSSMEMWRQAAFVDHFLSECVVVGGARRAARMATKWWRDPGIFEFIHLKSNTTLLWSTNDSVTVDGEFRDLVLSNNRSHDLGEHANRVAEEVTKAAYYSGKGEPAILNVDRFVQNSGGLEKMMAEGTLVSRCADISDTSREMIEAVLKRASAKTHYMICNPCGEIPLASFGGYCTIADVVPYHAYAEADVLGEDKARLFGKEWDDDAEEAFKTATRALIRTNLLPFIFDGEVARTNRIGVGMTGFHEWVWSRFQLNWRDMLDEYGSARQMWLTVSRFRRAVRKEAVRFSNYIGVTPPHTEVTIKPAGTTSKLFGLTEGVHGPAMREYLRWVQYRTGDPLIAELKAHGYPVRELTVYGGTTIVGFPTRQPIVEMMGDELVTAPEMSPEEQFEFLRLLEKYWIVGVGADGKPNKEDTGGQVSYTLKYDPKILDYDAFHHLYWEGMGQVKCCSVMPAEDRSAYEYLPEQPISKAEFEVIAQSLAGANAKEDVDRAHVDCANGACPVDFEKEMATAK